CALAALVEHGEVPVVAERIGHLRAHAALIERGGKRRDLQPRADVLREVDLGRRLKRGQASRGRAPSRQQQEQDEAPTGGNAAKRRGAPHSARWASRAFTSSAKRSSVSGQGGSLASTHWQSSSLHWTKSLPSPRKFDRRRSAIDTFSEMTGQ